MNVAAVIPDRDVDHHGVDGRLDIKGARKGDAQERTRRRFAEVGILKPQIFQA